MSRFTDLFQEPTPAPEATTAPEPEKVDNVVEFKPRTEIRSTKRKFTMD